MAHNFFLGWFYVILFVVLILFSYYRRKILYLYIIFGVILFLIVYYNPRPAYIYFTIFLAIIAIVWACRERIFGMLKKDNK